MNAVGFFGWWVNARVLHRETQSDGQIAVFDRWIVPVSSALEERDYAAVRTIAAGGVAEATAVRVAVIIPCFNEERTIGKVVSDFRRELPGAAIFVGDSSSTDGTALPPKKRGATVIPVYRQGKGGWPGRSFAKSRPIST